MNENYDAIVLGTGLKECIISGLLSVEGKKVLHVDKNPYYGGESASLNLGQIFQKMGRSGEPSEATYGPFRDYNIDLVPKFILAAGVMVKMLIKTEVTKYLEFRSINGSYVYKDKKIHKVPSSDAEAIKSSLMGLFEKRRCKKFFEFVQEFDLEKPKTHGGWDLSSTPMKTVFKKFDLESETQDFIGHALALYSDDEFVPFSSLTLVLIVLI
jgi:Rab GDP dissociation inhibitor